MAASVLQGEPQKYKEMYFNPSYTKYSFRSLHLQTPVLCASRECYLPKKALIHQWAFLFFYSRAPKSLWFYITCLTWPRSWCVWTLQWQGFVFTVSSILSLILTQVHKIFDDLMIYLSDFFGDNSTWSMLSKKVFHFSKSCAVTEMHNQPIWWI